MREDPVHTQVTLHQITKKNTHNVGQDNWPTDIMSSTHLLDHTPYRHTTISTGQLLYGKT